MHGDADATVPFDQSEKLLSALKQAGVICDLLRVPGGGHGATFEGAKNPPDYMGRMLSWLDRHLKAEGR
jgi:dipeptidyl aminopeptidase/acylaminoacyl peptidase